MAIEVFAGYDRRMTERRVDSSPRSSDERRCGERRGPDDRRARL